MGTALKSSWALFLGLLLIMIGNGLQGSLIGVRAQMENFGNMLTGLVMAGYFLGFFLGSFAVPKLLERVGHIRVFAALAALASLAAIVFPLFVDPISWFAMRVLIGLSYSGLYVVCESWMNDKSTNETRGQMLAIYMIVSLVGMAGGQLMLNTYNPADFQLFTIVSVLISLAAVPLLLSATSAPTIEAPESMGPFRLYKKSPMGVATIFFSGIIAGVMMGLGPAYAYKLHGTTFASFYMSAIFIGGFLFTWPIGKLSDKFDRRTVIIVVAACCGVASACGLIFDDPSRLSVGERFVRQYLATQNGGDWEQNLLLLITVVFGGFALALYSLSISHTNDYLTPRQMVSASSTLVMVNGIGAVIGPNLAGAAMDWLGTTGYNWVLIGICASVVAFGLWRMTRRAPLPTEEQGDHVLVSNTMGTIAVGTLNPDAAPLEEVIPDEGTTEEASVADQVVDKDEKDVDRK